MIRSVTGRSRRFTNKPGGLTRRCGPRTYSGSVGATEMVIMLVGIVDPEHHGRDGLSGWRWRRGNTSPPVLRGTHRRPHSMQRTTPMVPSRLAADQNDGPAPWTFTGGPAVTGSAPDGVVPDDG